MSDHHMVENAPPEEPHEAEVMRIHPLVTLALLVCVAIAGIEYYPEWFGRSYETRSENYEIVSTMPLGNDRSIQLRLIRTSRLHTEAASRIGLEGISLTVGSIVSCRYRWEESLILHRPTRERLLCDRTLIRENPA